ncbi:hypothetical protein LY78DRAFT_686835 [Colletotrichum sublineola]|nr:hypothetical protein LY78DRAFT_686835 [Colletotrichum sublineola]
MEQDESFLFDRDQTLGDLHEGLSTILEETSLQISVTDTPEQSRHSLPLTPTSSDRLALDSRIDTVGALSHIKRLGDSVQIRGRRKRSLSDSGILPTSGPAMDFGLQAPSKRRMVFTPSPETKPTTLAMEKSKPRTALEPLMDGIATLLPGTWANDTVINTISQRFTSTSVGVVDSLIFCASRTAKLRLRLRPVMSKEVVLIFLHEPGHWILFRWLSASAVLEEYNSQRPSSSSPPGVERVKVFLRWACSEDDMAIELRQVECPQQPNVFDCGIYALCFARRLLSDNESLNDPIDGVTERKYLVESLSTSWHRSISPAELRAIGLNTSHEKIHHARLVLEFRRRQRSYHELLRDGTAGMLPMQHIRLAVAADRNSVQQVALSIVISDFHRRHIESLLSALRTSASVAATRAKVDHEKDVKDKLQQLLDTLGNTSMPKESSTSMQEEVLRRSLAAIRENSYIAQSMWEALSHTPHNEYQTLRSTSHEAKNFVPS